MLTNCHWHEHLKNSWRDPWDVQHQKQHIRWSMPISIQREEEIIFLANILVYLHTVLMAFLRKQTVEIHGNFWNIYMNAYILCLCAWYICMYPCTRAGMYAYMYTHLQSSFTKLDKFKKQIVHAIITMHSHVDTSRFLYDIHRMIMFRSKEFIFQ